MKDQRTASDLDEQVKLLNAVLDEGTPWVRHRAKKEHLDMFGVTVRADSGHYFRRVGPSFDNVQRLAAESMERVCAAVLTGSPQLVDDARRRVAARIAHKAEFVKKLR